MNPTPQNTATETTAEDTAKPSRAHRIMRAELARTVTLLEENKTSEKLNDWEKSFLADLATRFRQYGLKTRLSMAQVMTMNRAVAKIVVA